MSYPQMNYNFTAGRQQWGEQQYRPTQDQEGYRNHIHKTDEPHQTNHWSFVLGISQHASIPEIKAAYRRLAKLYHSDAGGDDAAMSRLNFARDQAVKERGEK